MTRPSHQSGEIACVMPPTRDFLTSWLYSTISLGNIHCPGNCQVDPWSSCNAGNHPIYDFGPGVLDHTDSIHYHCPCYLVLTWHMLNIHMWNLILVRYDTCSMHVHYSYVKRHMCMVWHCDVEWCGGVFHVRVAIMHTASAIPNKYEVSRMSSQHVAWCNNMLAMPTW